MTEMSGTTAIANAELTISVIARSVARRLPSTTRAQV
jgi:hypothetical protein